MAHLLENCEEWTMPCPTKYILIGHSQAGERTGFVVKGLNIMLDCGIRTERNISAIFLTHSHSDHSGELPYNVKCRNPKFVPVCMPESSVEIMRQVEQSVVNASEGKIIEWGDDIWTRQKKNIKQVKPGEIFTLPEIKNIEIEIFEGFHTAESIGYGFSTLKTKLKSNIDKSQIKELLKKGVNIKQEVKVPEFLFFSDTTIEALTVTDSWKKYPVVIIECTQYPPRELPDNNYGKHVHWNDIFPIIKNNPDNFFVLIHHSKGIKNGFFEKFQSKITEDYSINNFKIWLNKEI